MNDEQVGICKEAPVVYFEVLFRNFLRKTEETRSKLRMIDKLVETQTEHLMNTNLRNQEAYTQRNNSSALPLVLLVSFSFKYLEIWQERIGYKILAFASVFCTVFFEAFFSAKNVQRVSRRELCKSSFKASFTFVRFQPNWNVSMVLSRTPQYQISRKSTQWLSSCYLRAEEQTDMFQLIGAFL